MDLTRMEWAFLVLFVLYGIVSGAGGSIGYAAGSLVGAGVFFVVALIVKRKVVG